MLASVFTNIKASIQAHLSVQGKHGPAKTNPNTLCQTFNLSFVFLSRLLRYKTPPVSMEMWFLRDPSITAKGTTQGAQTPPPPPSSPPRFSGVAPFAGHTHIPRGPGTARCCDNAGQTPRSDKRVRVIPDMTVVGPEAKTVGVMIILGRGRVWRWAPRMLVGAQSGHIHKRGGNTGNQGFQ